MEPRKVIGTVDTSEFVVALCASLGFLISLSFAEIPWQVVGALFAGGVVAAPIAAWIVKKLPTRILGTAVGGVILIVNMKTFFEAMALPAPGDHRLLPDHRHLGRGHRLRHRRNSPRPPRRRCGDPAGLPIWSAWQR